MALRRFAGVPVEHKIHFHFANFTLYEEHTKEVVRQKRDNIAQEKNACLKEIQLKYCQTKYEYIYKQYYYILYTS